MAFEQQYRCEFCQDTFWYLEEDIPESCEACDDTGDSRPNLEKYGCRTCDHLYDEESCDLVKPFRVEDIYCPLIKRK